MLITLVPLISLALGTMPAAQPAIEARAVTQSSPSAQSARSAQVQLVEMIGEADAIHALVPRAVKASKRAKRVPAAIEVALDRDGIAYRVIATIGARGEVTGLVVEERGEAEGADGNLSWLASEVANATAIVRVAIDEDDAVTLTTDAGDAFMIIPGRGSGGNAAVEARWAAAWDTPEA